MTRMTRGDVLRVVWEARERGVCPDLRYADLSGADLSGADLSGADLRGTNLRDATLQGADLSCASLHGADLTCTRWGGLVIDGLYPYRITLTPAPDGWKMTIGCWSGTSDELRVLIAGDDWPEARGDEITRRRPLLEAALHVVDAHITAHPNVIDELKERWAA